MNFVWYHYMKILSFVNIFFFFECVEVDQRHKIGYCRGLNLCTVKCAEGIWFTKPK